MTIDSSVARATGQLTWKTKSIRGAWMIFAAIGTVAVVVMLMRNPTVHVEHTAPPKAIEPVRVVGLGKILVSPDTPLQKELSLLDLKRRKITRPVLSVTGVVLARIREGSEPFEDRWQFNTPELSTSYADWLRTKNEIEFNTSQLNKTRDLSNAETTYLQINVSKLEKLSGEAVAEKDFRLAKSALLKAQIQGEKDIFAAQSALRAAVKQKLAIERDLSRSGIEPVVFERAAEHMVLVAAHVPEAKVAMVFEGQSCNVHFYGYPGQVFPGHVEAVSSMVTQDRRTLRVLFDLTDEMNLLKPGMFGEVGLGDEARDAMLIPATAVLHIARADYVLVAEGENTFRVTPVTVGEVEQGECECLSGLHEGQQILSRGAILLKTLAAQSLSNGVKETP